MDDERFYTVKELSDRWRVNAETIRRRIRQGELVAVRIGGTKAGHRIRASEVERFERDGPKQND